MPRPLLHADPTLSPAVQASRTRRWAAVPLRLDLPLPVAHYLNQDGTIRFRPVRALARCIFAKWAVTPGHTADDLRLVRNEVFDRLHGYAAHYAVDPAYNPVTVLDDASEYVDSFETRRAA